MSRTKDTLMDAIYAMRDGGMTADQIAFILAMDVDDVKWIIGEEV